MLGELGATAEPVTEHNGQMCELEGPELKSAQ
jgi:hypothetical protein